MPEANFKDSTGQLHPVHDVVFQANGSRGTWKGRPATDHIGGRGWLLRPGFAPLTVTVESVEPLPASAGAPGGELLYRFMQS